MSDPVLTLHLELLNVELPNGYRLAEKIPECSEIVNEKIRTGGGQRLLVSQTIGHSGIFSANL